MQTASSRQDERARKYRKHAALAERGNHGQGPVGKPCRSARLSPASAEARPRKTGHDPTVLRSGLALVVWMLLAMPREAAPLPSIADCSADETTLDGNQCRCPAGS